MVEEQILLVAALHVVADIEFGLILLRRSFVERQGANHGLDVLQSAVLSDVQAGVDLAGMREHPGRQ